MDGIALQAGSYLASRRGILNENTYNGDKENKQKTDETKKASLRGDLGKREMVN